MHYLILLHLIACNPSNRSWQGLSIKPGSTKINDSKRPYWLTEWQWFPLAVIYLVRHPVEEAARQTNVMRTITNAGTGLLKTTRRAKAQTIHIQIWKTVATIFIFFKLSCDLGNGSRSLNPVWMSKLSFMEVIIMHSLKKTCINNIRENTNIKVLPRQETPITLTKH